MLFSILWSSDCSLAFEALPYFAINIRWRVSAEREDGAARESDMRLMT